MAFDEDTLREMRDHVFGHADPQPEPEQPAKPRNHVPREGNPVRPLSPEWTPKRYARWLFDPRDTKSLDPDLYYE